MSPTTTDVKRKTGDGSKTAAADPLSAEELRKMHAYWRAANYLSVGQIYLMDNPLLKEPLQLKHIKPRLLGHWGLRPRHGFAVQAEARREVEGAPFPQRALNPDPPTHQLDQPRGDGQPQARAPEPAGHGAVLLNERLEHEALLVFRDARARVRDGKVQADLPLG